MSFRVFRRQSRRNLIKEFVETTFVDLELENSQNVHQLSGEMLIYVWHIVHPKCDSSESTWCQQKKLDDETFASAVCLPNRFYGSRNPPEVQLMSSDCRLLSTWASS